MIHCNPSALSLHLMIITQYRMHESSRMAKTLVGNRCSPPQGTKPMIRADAGFWTNKLPIRTFDGGVLSKRFRLFNRRRFLKFLYFCSSLKQSDKWWNENSSDYATSESHKGSVKTPAVYRHKLKMWANVQRDGRSAVYRWRPLLNAAKFGWRPLLECCTVTLSI